jgi:hypothetical protein
MELGAIVVQSREIHLKSSIVRPAKQGPEKVYLRFDLNRYYLLYIIRYHLEHILKFTENIRYKIQAKFSQ